MCRLKRTLAVVCSILLAAPILSAQDGSAPLPLTSRQPIQITAPAGAWSRVTGRYRTPDVSPIRLGNSSRLDALLRAGNLYLSLQDAIALALENNIDIEVQRYNPLIADQSVERAKAGGFARGVSTGVTAGPTSATGTGGQTGIQGNAASQAAQQGSQGGAFITQTGTAIPNLDPSIAGRASWGHFTTPQSSAFVTGTNFFIQRQDLSTVQYQQGFLSGTNVSLGLSSTAVTNNNRRADFNPSNTGTATLNVTQHLLQGFGPSVNNRQIRIAKNNRELSDLVFKQQVIETVSSIINLYWDLVSFNEDVRVKKQALALNEKLLSDNKKQVEIGTMAPIEIVRAEAEVARAQQDLTLSETQVLQQETIIKNVLSRVGVASPALADSRIIATDRINIPDVEAVAPVQDVMAQALHSRPELAQRRIQVENSRISLKGSKSALLPTLDAFVNLANNGLAGQPNTLPELPGFSRSPQSGFFVGGFGTVLTQLFARNFPDYSVGLQFNVPLRNRQAQADVATDLLSFRQSELGLQQLENQVRVQVQNALIGLQQARARYQAAVKNRVLQEQTLDAEQKKLELGASTPYNVILVQRDLAAAQSSEVAALSAYSRARTELDRSTGQTLLTNNISVEEAYRGEISRPPSKLPVLDPQQR